ncbi:hypothetical protein [Luteimonas panaciterrae]|uniref:hypothetical protein n=1 Tax=Luteimonas panaciterrae TaxID=363885 RepID=UPI001CFC2EED|nr:hypothetical protein [Luteimonas panaciterrae]
MLLVAMLMAACAAGRDAGLSDESLLGVWECGPTTMHGPNFDLVVTTRTTNNSDHTYSSLTTSVITPHGKHAITNKDLAYGSWRLEKGVVVSVVERVQFLSSSDPTFKNELGQKIQDDLLKKKSVFKSRILYFDGNISRSIPIDSMYKEAEVESTCRRV